MAITNEILAEIRKAESKNIKPKYLYLGYDDYNSLRQEVQKLTAQETVLTFMGLTTIFVERSSWLKIGE